MDELWVKFIALGRTVLNHVTFKYMQHTRGSFAEYECAKSHRGRIREKHLSSDGAVETEEGKNAGKRA